MLEEPQRSQVTIWCISIAYWIINATKTHSGYVILTAFPLQQWLPENSSMLLDAYIAFLAYNKCNKSHVKYSLVNRTIKSWNKLPASLLSSFSCKLNTSRKRVKNVVTIKGIGVGIECK